MHLINVELMVGGIYKNLDWLVYYVLLLLISYYLR